MMRAAVYSGSRNLYPDIKGFSVRNLQCMAQFYCEYNKELTMVRQNTKPVVAQLGNSANTQRPVAQLKENPNTQRPVAQIPKYNFELPIKKLSWAHNILLLQ